MRSVLSTFFAGIFLSAAPVAAIACYSNDNPSGIGCGRGGGGGGNTTLDVMTGIFNGLQNLQRQQQREEFERYNRAREQEAVEQARREVKYGFCERDEASLKEAIAAYEAARLSTSGAETCAHTKRRIDALSDVEFSDHILADVQECGEFGYRRIEKLPAIKAALESDHQSCLAAQETKKQQERLAKTSDCPEKRARATNAYKDALQYWTDLKKLKPECTDDRYRAARKLESSASIASREAERMTGCDPREVERMVASAQTLFEFGSSETTRCIESP